jgi:hypothetical protein
MARCSAPYVPYSERHTVITSTAYKEPTCKPAHENRVNTGGMSLKERYHVCSKAADTAFIDRDQRYKDPAES